MPAVSFVVTTYNKLIYLPHLLAGLAGQEGDFQRQFIFVDDGSTDGTVQTLKEMTSSWSDVTIIQQRNSGPAIAINKGFAAATGDFIKPVDGDDQLLPWATSTLLSALKEGNCRVAHATMDRQGTYKADRNPAVKPASHVTTPVLRIDKPLSRSLFQSHMNTTSWIAETSLVREIGGADEGVFIQDYSIELRMAARSAFGVVDGEIFLVPEEIGGRLTGNAAQTMHDVNLALMRFILGNKQLPNTLVRRAMRQAAREAWAWARIHGNERYGSPTFWAYLASRLGMLSPTDKNADILCAPFRHTNVIRLA